MVSKFLTCSYLQLFVSLLLDVYIYNVYLTLFISCFLDMYLYKMCSYILQLCRTEATSLAAHLQWQSQIFIRLEIKLYHTITYFLYYFNQAVGSIFRMSLMKEDLKCLHFLEKLDTIYMILSIIYNMTSRHLKQYVSTSFSV